MGKKYPKIVLEDFEYYLLRRLGSKTRWRCTSYRKSFCQCALLTYDRVVEVVNKHNHRRPLHLTRDDEFKQVVMIIKNK